MRSETGQIIARSVSVAEAPTRILVSPAGLVETTKGTYLMDGEAARAVIAAMAERGTDVVIDYEHQTLGGEHASPTGKAPAAGWIKSLEWAEGEGLYAEVEWTPAARDMLAAKEYRYLSPVLIYRRDDRRAVYLHSVALVNKPATLRQPALVNKDSDAHDPEDGLSDSASESGRKDSPMKDQIVGVLALKSDASDDVVLEAVREARTKALNYDEATDRLAVVCKAAGLEADLATPKIEAAVMVLRQKADQHDAIKSELDTLKAAAIESAAEQLVAAALAEGKLVPAQKDWATGLILKDRTAFEDWAKSAPIIAPPGKTTPPPAGTKADASRGTIIASARKRFEEESKTTRMVGSERTFIDQVLRDQKAAKLTDEEIKTLAIAGE